MNLATTHSVNSVPVRLTDERWEHIVDKRPFMSSYLNDVLAAVADPEYILAGQQGTLIAVVALGRANFLHVVYREVSQTDGFTITAYTRPKLDKRKIIWRSANQD